MTTTKTRKKTTTSSSEQEKLPPNALVFEILQLVSKQRTNQKKIEILKEYEHDSLKAIFIWNFDETVVSVLPPGDVPYFGDNSMKTSTISERIDEAVKQMDKNGSLGAVDQRHSTIKKEYTKFYNFVKGGNDSMNGIKRENIFINILEGIHPLEAEILCLVKDKRLQEKYKITKEIVAQAYPDIVWGNRG